MPHTKLLQIYFELKWLEPSIWRRVIVPDTITLKQFHKVIQIGMGWSDRHQHEFLIADKRYGAPELGTRDIFPEKNARLGKCLGNQQTFGYVYDFGDNWEFNLKVEEIRPMEELTQYPICIDGARASPPEDVGGPPGFLDFLEAISNPMHPGHPDVIEWYGDGFDAEAFDAGQVNQRLMRIRR